MASNQISPWKLPTITSKGKNYILAPHTPGRAEKVPKEAWPELPKVIAANPKSAKKHRASRSEPPTVDSRALEDIQTTVDTTVFHDPRQIPTWIQTGAFGKDDGTAIRSPSDYGSDIFNPSFRPKLRNRTNSELSQPTTRLRSASDGPALYLSNRNEQQRDNAANLASSAGEKQQMPWMRTGNTHRRVVSTAESRALRRYSMNAPMSYQYQYNTVKIRTLPPYPRPMVPPSYQPYPATPTQTQRHFSHPVHHPFARPAEPIYVLQPPPQRGDHFIPHIKKQPTYYSLKRENNSHLRRVSELTGTRDLINAVNANADFLFRSIKKSQEERIALWNQVQVLGEAITRDRDMHNGMIATYEKIVDTEVEKQVLMLEKIRQLRLHMNEPGLSTEPITWPTDEFDRQEKIQCLKLQLTTKGTFLDKGKERSSTYAGSIESSNPEGSTKLNAAAPSFTPSLNTSPAKSVISMATVAVNPDRLDQNEVLKQLVRQLNPYYKALCPHSLLFRGEECLNSRCTMKKLCENLKINQCKPNCPKIHARATCMSEGEGAVCTYKEDARGRSPTKRSPTKRSPKKHHDKKHSPAKYSQQSSQDREYHMTTKAHKEDCSAEDWKQRVLLAGGWLRQAHYEGRYMG